LRLTAEKLNFPADLVEATLEPNTVTVVSVPVTARSNGVFPVQVEVLTPAGNRLAGPVELTARVNTLAGLGRVVTVGALLVLASWWFSYFRRRRRTQREADIEAAHDRHPAQAVPTAETAPIPSSPAPEYHHLPVSIRIVTDSSCDLPEAVVSAHGIRVVPLSIRFGDEEFIDREQLSTDEFWARCAQQDTLPETAAPAPGQFEVVYRSLAEEGATGIVVVSLSGALSATMQSAELAARSVSDLIPVRVLDSRTVSLGVGTIVLACARLAADGGSLDEVEALAQDLAGRTHVFGALDTLDNLKKGGRIGNAKALLATALAIKPIIEVIDGQVEQGGKQRTRSKALKFLVDKVRGYEGRISDLAVLHADCSDVDEFVAMLRPYYSGEIVIGQIGPVIGTHAGRGTIGVAFQVTD